MRTGWMLAGLAVAWVEFVGPAWAGMAVAETGLRVHVGGEVRRPGLHVVPPGARVAEAIAAAGGPTPRARLEALNLAALVRDGDHVRVPAPGQATGAPVAATWRAASPRRLPRPKARSWRAVRPVDLNRASALELETLPGVGPAMAARIVATRRRLGGFKALEELREVPGIGARRLERLRPCLVL
ncbi:MAG: ComEA family DNA-binding protein [Candidatus Sericytochromatia bacterium]|nr:ComEA family DNA-binding protein [Candidatus Sericytochromatia bacterium]